MVAGSFLISEIRTPREKKNPRHEDIRTKQFACLRWHWADVIPSLAFEIQLQVEFDHVIWFLSRKKSAKFCDAKLNSCPFRMCVAGLGKRAVPSCRLSRKSCSEIFHALHPRTYREESKSKKTWLREILGDRNWRSRLTRRVTFEWLDARAALCACQFRFSPQCRCMSRPHQLLF